MLGESTSAVPHLNSTFDPEMDSFFDLDQNDYSTPTLSPATTRSHSTVNQGATSASSSFTNQSRQPAMSGPSHQYDAYRQQTGLPAGGLASTFAVNQATGMQYTQGSNGFVMPIDTLNFPLSSTDDYDFNNMSDMDFDADSPPANDLPAMFFPNKDQIVNPIALAGEGSSSSSVTYTPQVQRMYPGMHSQQAQAKAAAQKQQQEMARQQQQQQRGAALEGQRPLPSPKSAANTDPAVDERISRLLQQMRQNSTGSAEDESGETTSLPHLARMKKEDDDMDEDERLLASEEGKKLSSKERRQLRNKVSARAFRSRRKEYIGQLEGEVATKAQENDDLRVENRQLMEENARLTDLTRMLLSSSAFSGFLNELSVNGGSIPSALQKTPAAPQTQPQQQQQPLTRKDVNPNQLARQIQKQRSQNQHVGMTMIPETSVDFSTLDLNNSNGWNSGIDMNSYQVFALTSVPEPAIDVAALSGKPSEVLDTVKATNSKNIPILSSIPVTPKGETNEPKVNTDVELDGSLSLFMDSPVTTASSSPTSCSSLSSIYKPSLLTFVAPTKEDEMSNAARLESMCNVLDESVARIACMIPKL